MWTCWSWIYIFHRISRRSRYQKAKIVFRICKKDFEFIKTKYNGDVTSFSPAKLLFFVITFQIWKFQGISSEVVYKEIRDPFLTKSLTPLDSSQKVTWNVQGWGELNAAPLRWANENLLSLVPRKLTFSFTPLSPLFNNSFHRQP